MSQVIRKLLALLLLGALAACGGTADEDADGRIRVYAAASLTESFTALGKEFELATLAPIDTPRKSACSSRSTSRASTTSARSTSCSRRAGRPRSPTPVRPDTTREIP